LFFTQALYAASLFAVIEARNSIRKPLLAIALGIVLQWFLRSASRYGNGATAKGGTATPFRRTTTARERGMNVNSLAMG
jgi:uncharacterized membrane protein YadS